MLVTPKNKKIIPIKNKIWNKGKYSMMTNKEDKNKIPNTNTNTKGEKNIIA